MPLSHLPLFLTSAFLALAHWLDKRTAVRLPLLLAGVLFARGRRTVTSWFRAAGIKGDYRQGYVTVRAVGRQAPPKSVLDAIAQLVERPRQRLVAEVGQRSLAVGGRALRPGRRRHADGEDHKAGEHQRGAVLV